MAYRVMLVDDEPWILQGLCESFPWEKYDMHVAGSYTKASLALEAILEQKPDAVFTDIRMPGISGIELMHALRDSGLDTEIVIISGFSQFEYAREAIRVGAFDYCLKPIDEEMTDSLLSRLKVKLDKKEDVKNSRVVELLTDDFGNAERNPAYSRIPRTYSFYQMVLFTVEEKEALALLDTVLPASAEYMSFKMGGGLYFLINTEVDLYPVMEGLGGQHTIGISSLAESLGEISALTTEAMMASQSVLITGHAGVYRYHAKHYAMLAPLVRRATRLVDEGKMVEFRALVAELPAHFITNEFSVEDLCYVWNQLVIYAEGRFPEKVKLSGLSILEWREMDEKFSGMDDFCQTLISEFQFCCGPIGKKEDGIEESESNFGRMIQYLNEHYNEQVKLKDLAQQFFINKNYACFLFKKHTNMTYSEYLNSIRLNKAKDLLVSTSLSISEVAERAGYADYFYFSKLFKKIYGVTPAQFRKQPLPPQNDG